MRHTRVFCQPVICLFYFFKAPPDPKVPPAQLVLADPRALKVTLASVDHQDKEERKEHQAAQEHQDQKVLSAFIIDSRREGLETAHVSHTFVRRLERALSEVAS